MGRLKLVALAAVVGGALAVPATSGAQDVGSTCNSLLGSDTTQVGGVSIQRCFDSNPPACELNNTINVLNIARIRFGFIAEVKCAAQNGAGVKGLVTILLP